FGPWKTIYSGEWLDFKTTIFENSEHALLLIAFDKAGGALVLMKKGFLLEGNDVELLNFLNSQKRVLTVLEKTSRIGRFKYLLLETDPSYSTAIVRELPLLLRTQKAFLDSVGKALEEIAKTYGAKATDFARAPEQAIELLLGDPFQALAFKPGGSAAATGRAREANAKREKVSEQARAVIGMNAAREPVQIVVSELRKTLVVGETREKQLHLMHLLTEAALENGVSCVILATSNAWNGLSDANPDKTSFETFRLATQPHGFPLKRFAQGEGLYVNLKKIDAVDFTQAFGLHEEAGEAISKAFGDAASLDDLATNVKTLGEKDSPAVAKSKALRVLHLIRKECPLLFGEDRLKRLETAFTRAKEKNIVVANVIDLSKETRAVRELVARSIAVELNKVLEESAESASLNAFVAVEEDYASLSSGLKKELVELADAGVGAGVAFRANHTVDAQDFSATLSFELVGAEAVMFDGSARTRFAPRPAFSTCREFPQVLQAQQSAQPGQAPAAKPVGEGKEAKLKQPAQEQKKEEKPLPFHVFFKHSEKKA
ncbi:hypothetical protein H0N96_00720, partial [Candidatus Micrarchaeota archaeon]|nr:hypothetical protein [Candidatus Micrarchaeota archaeon]